MTYRSVPAGARSFACCVWQGLALSHPSLGHTSHVYISSRTGLGQSLLQNLPLRGFTGRQCDKAKTMQAGPSTHSWECPPCSCSLYKITNFIIVFIIVKLYLLQLKWLFKECTEYAYSGIVFPQAPAEFAPLKAKIYLLKQPIGCWIIQEKTQQRPRALPRKGYTLNTVTKFCSLLKPH